MHPSSIPRAAAVLLGLACMACPGGDPVTMVSTSGGSSTTDTDGTASSSVSASDSTSAPATDSTGPLTDPSGDSTGASDVQCEDPVPVMQRGLDVPTGFEQCADGRVQRVGSVTCEVPLPQSGCEDPDFPGLCVTDDDCNAGPYGVCGEIRGGAGTSCECLYGCQTDADCGEGEVCACGGDAPGYPEYTRCIPADCQDSSECPDGLCRVGSHYATCDPGYIIACTTPEDACVISSDCEPAPMEVCYPVDGQWVCEYGICL